MTRDSLEEEFHQQPSQPANHRWRPTRSRRRKRRSNGTGRSDESFEWNLRALFHFDFHWIPAVLRSVWTLVCSLIHPRPATRRTTPRRLLYSKSPAAVIANNACEWATPSRGFPNRNAATHSPQKLLVNLIARRWGSILWHSHQEDSPTHPSTRWWQTLDQ